MTRKNHPPVAAQKIGLPRAAQFRLEQRFVRPAERTQTVEAGNHHAFRFRARPARIAGDNLADEPPISFRFHQRQFRCKTGVIKKLPRRAHHHEATMIISRRRIGVERWSSRRSPDRNDIATPARAGTRRCRAQTGKCGRIARSAPHDYLAARVSFSTGWPAPGMPASVSSADSTLVSAMKAETPA